MQTWIHLAQQGSSYLRETTNRPPSTLDPRVFLFDEITQERDAVPRRARAVASSPLLFVVTTCQRAGRCEELLRQISSSLASVGLKSQASVLVIEDGTTESYAASRARASALFGERHVWLRSRVRMGKRGYWLTYQRALSFVEGCAAERVFFVQDDIDWPQEVVGAGLEYLSEIEQMFPSPQPVVLNLFSSEDDEPEGRWTRFSREPHPHLPVRRTQWFDLNSFLLNRRALEVLKFRLVPISEHRWDKDPQLSSGVGRQLTRRLGPRGAIYQCFPPLVYHGGASSVMNPGARAERSLDNRAFRHRGAEG